MKKPKITIEELEHMKSRQSQFPVEDVFAASPKTMKRSVSLKKSTKAIKRAAM